MSRECLKYLLRSVIAWIVTQNNFGIYLSMIVPLRLLLGCDLCKIEFLHDCLPDPALPALLHCHEYCSMVSSLCCCAALYGLGQSEQSLF